MDRQDLNNSPVAHTPMRRESQENKDLYLHKKAKYEEDITDISKQNSEIILKYVTDMECGLNISSVSKKGSRGYEHLYGIFQKMVFFVKHFEEEYDVYDLTKLNERQLFDFFLRMRNGELKKKDGKIYTQPTNFVKIFKAFWHWWMKVNQKQGIKIYDITQDLDTSRTKPKWVYLDQEQVKNLYYGAKHYYQILIMFLYDSGVRAPSELRNIKVSDFYDDFKEVQIRDEISKTFGRRIKLMISSKLIKDYVKYEKLGKDDYLFNRKPATMNQYLQRLAKRTFSDKVSLAGGRYHEITMYDFRHCSCCYWLPRYKSESALKYRFGWKKSDKIHYYSNLLGMLDTITEEDLILDNTLVEMQKELIKAQNEETILTERVKFLEGQMKIIGVEVKKMHDKTKRVVGLEE